jgi:hypothetical protein
VPCFLRDMLNVDQRVGPVRGGESEKFGSSTPVSNRADCFCGENEIQSTLITSDSAGATPTAATNLSTAQCNRGINQSRPFPARSLKIMESAGHHERTNQSRAGRLERSRKRAQSPQGCLRAVQFQNTKKVRRGAGQSAMSNNGPTEAADVFGQADAVVNRQIGRAEATKEPNGSAVAGARIQRRNRNPANIPGIARSNPSACVPKDKSSGRSADSPTLQSLCVVASDRRSNTSAPCWNASSAGAASL